jgi:hypothetical protein
VTVSGSSVGRDIVLGTALAAIGTMLRDNPGEDYPMRVVEGILLGLGVTGRDAAAIARKPLPPLVQPEVRP